MIVKFSINLRDHSFQALPRKVMPVISSTTFLEMLTLYQLPKSYSENVKSGIFMDTHGILSVRDFFGDGNIIFYGILTFLRLRVPRAGAKTKSLILNCDYKVTELWNLVSVARPV